MLLRAPRRLEPWWRVAGVVPTLQPRACARARAATGVGAVDCCDARPCQGARLVPGDHEAAD